jgi:hypothetical protein
MSLILTFISVVFIVTSLINIVTGGFGRKYGRFVKTESVKELKGEESKKEIVAFSGCLLILYTLTSTIISVSTYIIAFYGQYDDLQIPSLAMLVLWVINLLVAAISIKRNRKKNSLDKINVDDDVEVHKFINEDTKTGVKFYIYKVIKLIYFAYLFIAITLL